jgi:hypothetical protein
MPPLHGSADVCTGPSTTLRTGSAGGGENGRRRPRLREGETFPWGRPMRPWCYIAIPHGDIRDKRFDEGH